MARERGSQPATGPAMCVCDWAPTSRYFPGATSDTFRLEGMSQKFYTYPGKMENTTESFSAVVSASDLNYTEYHHSPEAQEEIGVSIVPCCNEETHVFCNFYRAFLPMLIAFTVVTSVVSCVVTCCAPWVMRPMSASVRLSLSLSAANTLFAVTWTLYLVVNIYLKMIQCVPVPGCFMLTLEVLRLGSILVQVLHLLAVALSHYLGSLRPLHYSTTATPAALRLILAVVWIVPLVGVAVVFASVPGQGFRSREDCANITFYQQEVTFRLVWSCIFFGPTVVIVLVYCHIFYLLRQRSIYLRDTPMAMTQHFNVKVFTDTFIYAVRLPAVRKALWDMWKAVKKCGRSSTLGRTHYRHKQLRRASTSQRTVSFGLSTYTSSSLQRLLEGVRVSIQGRVRSKGGRSSCSGTRAQVNTKMEVLPAAHTRPISEDDTGDVKPDDHQSQDKGILTCEHPILG
ncbi:5-hydroxytryptamine receptor 2B [Portunus trituberculatus]|uniref:5-hydroxytryptamine receptor 2B n=1 Tax=Portunus trituberculatus TaxID=210409 RepID=A0A5B7CL06_PORTR|nr:5-hydroxytryptamine receptor 2B [Portunus trituberculatus]